MATSAYNNHKWLILVARGNKEWENKIMLVTNTQLLLPRATRSEINEVMRLVTMETST